MQASVSAPCGLPAAVKAQAPLNAASTCWRAPVHRRPARAQVRTHAANTSSFSSMASQDDNGEPLSHRVYMIDPENSPGMVQEFQVEPHPDIDRAHEVLNNMEAQDFGGSPSNWGEEAHAALEDNNAALATQQAEFSQSLSTREAKASEMQKALVSQLEMEQRQVIELQRYEGLYKEVMMRADRSEADVAYMQNMVAEKDAELAHTYKLLENSARERSRLRQEHQAAQERMRDLQVQLIQAQAQARAPKMGALGAASPAAPPPKKEGAGTGAGAGVSPSSPSSVNGAIEELTNLAYSLAMDMSEEVKGFYPKNEGGSSAAAAEGPLSESSRATPPASSPPPEQPPFATQQPSPGPASPPPSFEPPSHVPPPSSRFHRANASMR